jgi:uncharacterized membrane-anchored protein YitT (DUF2179 family)
MTEDWLKANPAPATIPASAKVAAEARPRIREEDGTSRRTLADELDHLRDLKRYSAFRLARTAAAVVASALLQAFAITAFANPANLLSGGFTGIAMLIDKLTCLFGFSFPTFVGMIALNIPVAMVAWRSISKRFVLFSMAQVFLAAIFVRVVPFEPVLDNTMLQVVFGGFIYGMSLVLALRGGASTAGTDFISLMVSNKTGKTIWGQVFAGNCIVLCIFGVMFGWTAAAYSIIFQFISTKTIDSFYHRYDRMTLQITTSCPDEVLDAYAQTFRHGSSCVECIGGYSRERFWLINTVVSSYEVEEVVALVRRQDPGAVVNVYRTEDFFGGFYRAPIE